MTDRQHKRLSIVVVSILVIVALGGLFLDDVANWINSVVRARAKSEHARLQALDRQQPPLKVNVAATLPRGDFDYATSPQGAWEYGQKWFAPHQQFNNNMNVAEAWYRAHQSEETGWFYYRKNGQSPIDAACLGLTLMIKYQDRLEIPDSTLRAKYARLWSYYRWSNLDYDEETAQMLKDFAKKIPGVKYRPPNESWEE